MPKDTKLIVNRDLMRTFNWFLQENSKQPANPQMWQLLFSEIFKAEYIIPADTSKIKLGKNTGNEFNMTDDSQIAFSNAFKAETERIFILSLQTGMSLEIRYGIKIYRYGQEVLRTCRVLPESRRYSYKSLWR